MRQISLLLQGGLDRFDAALSNWLRSALTPSDGCASIDLVFNAAVAYLRSCGLITGDNYLHVRQLDAALLAAFPSVFQGRNGVTAPYGRIHGLTMRSREGGLLKL